MRGLTRIASAAIAGLAFATTASAQVPARRSPSWSTPFEVVLDSIELARGRGRPLVAFLAGRVPGLTISHDEWPETGTPHVTSSTTSGSFALSEPRLYIDGMLIRDDPAWDNAPDGSGVWWGSGQRPPSMGWGIPLEDIAEVRVLLGPAGSGELRWGGSRGAVLVTTRRGARDRRRVWSSLQATGAGARYAPRTNWAATGVIGGNATDRCRLADRVNGSCTTPTAAVTWNPLAELIPVKGAFAYRSSVGASGPLLSHVTYRTSLTDGAGEGGLPGNRAHRTDASASVVWDDGLLELSLDARVGRMVSKRAGWNAMDLEAYGAWAGGVRSDSIGDFFRLLQRSTLDRAVERESNRYSVAARATITLTQATEFDFALGFDELTRGSYGDYVANAYCDNAWYLEFGCIGWSSDRVQAVDHGSVRGKVSAAALRHRVQLTRTVRADLRAGVSDEDSDLGYWAGDYIDPEDVLNWHQTHVKLGGRSEEVAVRLTFGDRGSVSAAHRKAFHRDKSFDGQYDVLRDPTGRVLGLTRLTAAAAYGESDDGRSQFPVAPGTTFPDFPVDRAIERRFGFVAQWGARLEAAVDRSTTTTSNGTLLRGITTFPGLATVWYASWRVEATQARIGLRSAPDATVAWWTRLSIVDRSSWSTHLPDSALRSEIRDGLYRMLGDGSPTGEIRGRSYRYADANDDGVLVPTEVTLTPNDRYLGSAEPRWTYHLTGGIEPLRGLSLDAVVEARRGQVAFDRAGYLQCWYSRCAALYRPGVSLADQAAAIAADDYGIPTGFIHDASFVRLRELSVEYRFDDASRLGGMSIRLTGHDLVTLTGFPGGDPTVMSYAGAVPSGEVMLGHRRMPALTMRVEWRGTGR